MWAPNAIKIKGYQHLEISGHPQDSSRRSAKSNFFFHFLVLTSNTISITTIHINQSWLRSSIIFKHVKTKMFVNHCWFINKDLGIKCKVGETERRNFSFLS